MATHEAAIDVTGVAGPSHDFSIPPSPGGRGSSARVCNTQVLFLQPLSRVLSSEVVTRIVAYALPTVHPSAQALKQMYVMYPWVGPMQRAFPEEPFCCFAFKPQDLGRAWCCCCNNRCFFARLNMIRRKYDPHFERCYDEDSLEDSDDNSVDQLEHVPSSATRKAGC